MSMLPRKNVKEVLMEAFDLDLPQQKDTMAEPSNENSYEESIELIENQVILDDPADCIQIPNLQEEMKQYKWDSSEIITNAKTPQEIYLQHCNEFSKSNMTKNIYRIQQYRFKKEEQNKLLLSSHIWKCGDFVYKKDLKEEDNETDEELTTPKFIYQIDSLNFFDKFEIVEDIVTNLQEMNKQKEYQNKKDKLQNDEKKDDDVFVPILQTKLFMVISTWQKVSYKIKKKEVKKSDAFIEINTEYTPLQSKLTGNIDYSANKSPMILKADDPIFKIQPFQLQQDSAKFNQSAEQINSKTKCKTDKCVSTLVTDSSFLENDSSFMENEDCNEIHSFYIKTLQVYDECFQLKMDSLVEVVDIGADDSINSNSSQSAQNKGAKSEIDEIFKISTIMFKKKMYYFKRHFDEKKLQLYRFDFQTEQESIVTEFEKDEIQCSNITFSQEFGGHKNSKTKYKLHNSDTQQPSLQEQQKEEIKFLNQQFIITQNYFQNENTTEIFQLDNLDFTYIHLDEDTNYQDRFPEHFFTQMMFHIRGFNQNEGLHFLLFDRDKFQEITFDQTYNSQKNEMNLKFSKQKTFFQRKKNQTEECINLKSKKYYFQKTVPKMCMNHLGIKHVEIMKFDIKIKMTQYYFIDHNNKIQLLFPLYDQINDAQHIIELIEIEIGYEQKDKLKYQRIHIHENNKCNNSNDRKVVYQQLEHLKIIIDEDEISHETSIKFCQIIQQNFQVLLLRDIQNEFSEKGNKKKREQLKLIFVHGPEIKIKSLENRHTVDEKRRMTKQFSKSETVMFSKINQNNKKHQQKKKKLLNRQNEQKINKMEIQQSLKMLDSKMKERQDKGVSVLNQQQVLYNFDSFNDNCDSQSHSSFDSDRNKDNVLKMIDKNGHTVNVQIYDSYYPEIDNDWPIGIVCILYQKSQTMAQFVFVVESSLEHHCNRSYVFVQKTHDDLQTIIENKEQIIKRNERVMVLQEFEKKTQKFGFKEIEFYDLMRSLQEDQDNENTIKKSQKSQRFQEKDKMNTNRQSHHGATHFHTIRNIKLSFPLLSDEKKLQNFVVFVYQEQNDMQNNRMVVFDILKKEIVSQIFINPCLSCIDDVSKDENDFRKYQICRISDIEEWKPLNFSKQNLILNQRAKFSILTYFKDRIGRISCQDFLVENERQQTTIKITAIKQIFKSKHLIQMQDKYCIEKTHYIPFYDQNGSIKGSQIIWLNSQIQDKNCEKDHESITMLDADLNNVYSYQSEIVSVGQHKIILDCKNPEIYVNLVGATLNKNVIQKSIFENIETNGILQDMIQLTTNMIVADLKYLILNTFDDVKQKDFFSKQELLYGKSIFDISIRNDDEVQYALKNLDKHNKFPQDSMISIICRGDESRKLTMKKTDYMKQDLKIQQDFNLIGTIQRAIETESFATLKLVLNYVFQNINSQEYRNNIMFNLPLIICQSKIQINEFFGNEDLEGKGKIVCNMEILFKNINLPAFSDVQNSQLYIHELLDFNTWKDEIELQIIQENKKSLIKTEQKFEVEHSYVDFQYMIIGQKVRNYLSSRKDETTDVGYKFNDYELSKLLITPSELSESEIRAFYGCETIQKLIESQWQESKKVYIVLLFNFLFLFILPLGVHFTQISNYGPNRNLLLFICIIPELSILAIEIIQMQNLGLKYFIGWNYTDIVQLITFSFYAMSQLTYLEYDEEIYQEKLDQLPCYHNVSFDQRTCIAQIKTQYKSNKSNNLTMEFDPELKFIITILSFVKLCSYLRIYDDFAFMVQLVIFCVFDLVPFIICQISFLLIITISQIILNVDCEIGDTNSKHINFFQKMLLGNFRSAIGMLTMPGYSEIDKVCASNNDKVCHMPQLVIIHIIWIWWMITNFFMSVILLNFLIAVISSTYNKVKEQEKTINFQSHAELNYEVHCILKLFKKQKEFKVLVFTNSKDKNILDYDNFSEMALQIKKFIGRENRECNKKSNELFKQIKEVTKAQNLISTTIENNINEFDQKQDQLKEEILNLIKWKAELNFIEYDNADFINVDIDGEEVSENDFQTNESIPTLTQNSVQTLK